MLIFLCFIFLFFEYINNGDFMNLKKIKIIGVISIFLFTILFHFLYDLFPITLFSFLFPVNESIWEHMKLLYTGIIIWSIIEYFLLRKFNIKYNNFFYQVFLTAFSSILVYLIIYIPLFSFFGENMFISIFLLIFVIFIEEVFGYFLLSFDNNKYLLNRVSIFLLILFYFVFISFTYFPIHNYLFYDFVNHDYGIFVKK